LYRYLGDGIFFQLISSVSLVGKGIMLMCDNNFNYNNYIFLSLNREDLQNNKETIDYIYQYYEDIEGGIIEENGEAFLYINGYKIAEIDDPIDKLRKVDLEELYIDDGKIYAYVGNYNEI
jgi:hypothetical protein